jgi:hypothetical protein
MIRKSIAMSGSRPMEVGSARQLGFEVRGGKAWDGIQSLITAKDRWRLWNVNCKQPYSSGLA